MSWLTTWPGAITVALAVSLLTWLLLRWYTPTVPWLPIVLVTLCAVLAMRYGAATWQRAQIVAELTRVRGEAETLRGDLERARVERAEVLRKVAALEAERQRHLAIVVAQKTRDREHVRRRAELDAVKLPTPAPVESREQAIAVIRRHAQ